MPVQTRSPDDTMNPIKRALGMEPCKPDRYCDPYQGGGDLHLTYLGTAGFIVSDGEHTVVLDPCVSRPGLLRILTSPLELDIATISRHILDADDVPARGDGGPAHRHRTPVRHKQHIPVDYVREVVELLKPRWIVPCHWDTMITPYETEPDMIPGVDLPGFMAEIRAAGATPLLVPMRGSLSFPACRHDRVDEHGAASPTTA